MASKKKKGRAKGKGKNAAKNLRGKEQQQGTLDAQMERLKIDEDSQVDEEALLEEAIKLASAEKEALGCCHGYGKAEADIGAFANTFISYLCSDDELGLYEGLTAATTAIKLKYSHVWHNVSKLKMVVSFFASAGTQCFLEGDFDNARFLTAIACHFCNISSMMSGDQATIKSKMFELFQCDEHTLVKYLRQNIPCSCLDDKYEEVKSITKMGVCFNSQCNLPNREVERSKMLSCARCGDANYCSRECQKAAWPEHKELCNLNADLNAKWKSMKQSQE